MAKPVVASFLAGICLSFSAMGCDGGKGDNNPIVSEEPPADSPSIPSDSTPTNDEPVGGTGAARAVVFADARLEAAVRDALEQPADLISLQSLLSLTELDASGRQIEDLDGIEQLTRLSTLSLARNRIRDISPLASLGHLTLLDLTSNQIADISALATLTRLQVLLLGDNLIQDASSLSDLPGLVGVDLSDNPLSATARSEQLPALAQRGVEVAAENTTAPPQDGIEESLPEELADNAVVSPQDEIGQSLPEELAQLKIVFRASNDLGQQRLFSLNADGQNLTELPVRLKGRTSKPSWSADGTRIVFGSEGCLYIAHVDGSEVRQITDGPAFDLEPLWLQDDAAILFGSITDDDFALYTMREDGSDRRKVVDIADRNGWYMDPVLSPNGRDLVFSMWFSDTNDIDLYLLDTHEGTLANLTDFPGNDLGATWSPDGTTVAYSGERDGAFQVFTVKPRTMLTYQLTFLGNNSWPSWSPNSLTIVFSSDQNGFSNLYTIDADGLNLAALIDDQADYFKPSWSPSGDKILFVLNRRGRSDLYMVDKDGTNPTNLTDAFSIYVYDNALPTSWFLSGKYALRTLIGDWTFSQIASP